MTLSPIPSEPLGWPARPRPSLLGLAPLPPVGGSDRPAPFGVAKSLPDTAQSVYLGDYIRMIAEQAPDLAKDEDYALVYNGERLVARIHNSGAATLFGVDTPADWLTDASGLQGPAEAQRRAEQFAGLGYTVKQAATAASENEWRPPAPLFDAAGFEAYAKARDAAATGARPEFPHNSRTLVPSV